MNSDIEKHIALNAAFEDLPQSVRQLLGNSEKEYNKQVLDYSIKTQLQYRGNLVSQLVKNERSYYEQLVQTSRRQLMLYPYHLAQSVVAGLRVSPFQYYCDTLVDIMEQEKSYDALPNFTAVDCVRLLGIGRNQYIELMNQRRSGRSRLFMRKPGRELLPPLPSPQALQHMQSWWLVRLGRVTQTDVKSNVTAAEKLIIDLLIDNGPQLAGAMDRGTIHGLYSKGLIYLDVPLEASDRVSVPPLEGFVMNRVTGDFMESLLYRVFVSIDEHSSVSELASVLDTDLRLVKLALSLFCRLGFAQRKAPPPSLSGDASPLLHPSWGVETDPHPEAGSVSLAPERSQEELLLQELESALADDPSLYLERNLEPPPPLLAPQTPGGGPPLPLPSATTPVDITASLETPTTTSNRSLADDPRLLPPSQGGLLGAGGEGAGAGKKRIAFLFDSTLTAFLMMGNLSPDLKNHAVTLFEVGKLPDEGLNSLIHELSKIPQCPSEGEAERYFTHALTLRTALTFLRNNPALGDGEGVALDLVRWESLCHLDPATTARLLNKNYRLLVSMCPLNYEIPPLPLLTPPHFGPPAPAATTHWFRLLLYHTTGSGPNTLLLPRGYRLRRLPSCLLRHQRVLVTGWGQEPTLLPLQQLLCTANDALTHYPLLLQGYGWQQEAVTQHVCLPLEEDDVWWQCPAVAAAVRRLRLHRTFGYLQLLAFPSLPTPPPTPPPPSRGAESLSEGAERAAKRAESLSEGAESLSEGAERAAKRAESLSEGAEPVSKRVASLSEGAERSEKRAESLSEGAEPVSKRAGSEGVAGAGDVLLSSDGEDLVMLEVPEQLGSSSSSRSRGSLELNLEQQSTGGSKAAEADHLRQNWLLHDCHFGLPLFNAELNQRISAKISRHRLLAQDSVLQFSEEQAVLVALLDEFIQQHKGYDVVGSGVPQLGGTAAAAAASVLPSQPLQFADGCLTVWDGH